MGELFKIYNFECNVLVSYHALRQSGQEEILRTFEPCLQKKTNVKILGENDFTKASKIT